jgi:hypothetical protein
MSTTSSNPPPVRGPEVRFAEVDFPGVIQSRLVIEYSDGLKSIIVEELIPDEVKANPEAYREIESREHHQHQDSQTRRPPAPRQ